MADLLSAKGTIYRISKSWLSGGRPYFSVNDSLFRRNSDAGFIIIDDIQIAENDAFAKYACLENKKVFYLFGKHFGSIQINCTAYMGANLIGFNDKRITDALDKLRISTSQKTMKAQAGTKVYQFFLTNYQLGGTDHNLHARSFSLHGVLVDK